MARSPARATIETTLNAAIDSNLPSELRVEQLRGLRAQGPEFEALIDRFFIERGDSTRADLQTLLAQNEELQEIAEKLAAAPHPIALYRGAQSLADGRRLALVAVNGTDRLIQVAPSCNQDDLVVGDRVVLASEGNAVLAKAGEGMAESGTVVTVERWDGERRIIVKDRGQAMTVPVAGALTPETLRVGDQVRLDGHVHMAMEKVAVDGAAKHAVSAESTTVPLEAIAGYDDVRDDLIRRTVLPAVHAELARSYGVSQLATLLVGPPGTGKTRLAQLLASELTRRSDKPCRIIGIKAAELYSPYVGETEQNTRELFAAAKREPNVWHLLFIDEFDAIARARGEAGNVHSDRFLGSLLTEIQGFDRDSQGRMILIAATNRADALDPAARERFGVEVHIPRPGIEAARAIFDCHLGPAYPYRPNGGATAETRRAIIDAAVSYLYHPNAEGSRVATLRLRDGKTRAVAARDLVSGRLIEQIALDARRRAFQREVAGGESGITEADMGHALELASARLRQVLTPRNAHSYLVDLPFDVAVVAVEPAGPALGRKRFLNA